MTAELYDERSMQPSAILRGHTDVVRVLETSVIGDTPVLLSGGDDGSVRAWDLRTGTSLFEPLTGQVGPIVALAVELADDRPAVFAASNTTVLRWDMRTGDAAVPIRIGHSGEIAEIAFGRTGGRVAVLTQDSDGALHLWDSRSGRQIGHRMRNEAWLSAQVAVCDVDGRPTALSSVRVEDEGFWRCGIWVCDVLTGEPRYPPVIPESMTYSYERIEVGELDGHPVFAIDGAGWKHLPEVVPTWDLRSGCEAGRMSNYGVDDIGPKAIALGSVDNRPVAVAAGYELLICDRRAGRILFSIEPFPFGVSDEENDNVETPAGWSWWRGAIDPCCEAVACSELDGRLVVAASAGDADDDDDCTVLVWRDIELP